MMSRIVCHFMVFIITLAYMIFGAYLFCKIENLRSDKDLDFLNNTAYILLDKNTQKWSLLDGFLYVYYTVTTIGYSHLYTATDNGRIFYVLYGTFGIALFAIVINNLASYLEALILFCIKKLFKIRYVEVYDTFNESKTTLFQNER